MPTIHICSAFTTYNKVKHTHTATSLQTYCQRNGIFKGMNSSGGGDWKHFRISGKEHFNIACHRHPVKPSWVSCNTFGIASLRLEMNFCYWLYCKIELIHCTRRLFYSNDNFCLLLAIHQEITGSIWLMLWEFKPACTQKKIT